MNQLAVLEIDPAAIVANWRHLCQVHSTGAVAAVVKADAYGLGVQHVAPHLHAAGCRRFFVAHLDEALLLRKLVIDAAIYGLNGLLPGTAATYAAHAITPVLGSLAEMTDWRAAGGGAAILHVDTGMNRLGLTGAEVAALADDPHLLDGIDLAYIMTHLASAERPDDPLNALQLRRFRAACARLPAAPTSLANSSGIFLGADFGSALARPGAALYGINPTPGSKNPMQPGIRLLARVLAVRDIPIGEGVGYNATWRAARPSRIATIGVGYADGWLRALSGRSTAFFDGKPVPLVGLVSMDLSTYDVTDHPDIIAGSWLELLGPNAAPDMVGQWGGTIGYEILTSLGSRYARIVKPA